jgi:TolB-like protein/Tfp pilus assembly protein PilF
LSGISHAVFLSYASQDAEAAQHICEALRAAGIEVFLDQSELRGGDAWDQKIRHEIHDCVLFIPIVSQHTQERLEGYFRHEWRLAIERTHHMAEQKPFLVPVVVDGTRDQEAFVPDGFRAVQWTHLPGGETPPAFVERIKRLLSPELSPMSAVSGPAPGLREPVRPTWRLNSVLLAIVAIGVVAAPTYFLANKFWIAKHATPEMAARSGAPSSAFNPPPHSIAVLPFVNMSGDKEQEYFSDGLAEELLNSLAEINELQVAARTSSFSFKGEKIDVETIARKLNVGAVLEGSVRRSGNTVRVTTQLINAVTGFHLWSHTYDHDLGDVLRLQTEIADAVAGALKVTLLGDAAAKIELGGTHNPAAFDAYLRAVKAHGSSHEGKDLQSAITEYTEAIRLDPKYALALAGRALAHFDYHFVEDVSHREGLLEVQADADKALDLAPNLAEGHLALGKFLLFHSLDFKRANEEYDKAASLAPGNAMVLRDYGRYAVHMGRAASGIAASRRAVVLDPLNHENYTVLARALYFARQYDDAISTLQDSLALDPDDPIAYAYRGLTFYALGNFEGARASCERMAGGYEWVTRPCLAVTYDKLGRHADAQVVLTQEQALLGNNDAYQYAQIYAQWGNSNQALEWLETALRLRDPGMVYVKTDPLLDPLRKEPRFEAIERELKFPN